MIRIGAFSFFVFACVSDLARAATAGPLRPFLDTHCAECHDADTQKGKFRVDQLDTLKPADAVKSWGRILTRLEAGEMPPAKKPRPPQAELSNVLATVKAALASEAKARRNDGRTHIRRLNRLEYENTVRDLLHIETPLRDLLPEDDLADGFDTGEKGLSISPVHIQRYMDAAERALAAAVIRGPRPELKKVSVSFADPAENTYQNLGHAHNACSIHVRDGKIWFFSEAHIEVPIHSMLFGAMTKAAPGRYRVTVTTHTDDDQQQPLALFLKARRTKHDFGYFDAPLGKPASVVVEHDFKAGDSVVMMPYNLREIRRARGLKSPGPSSPAQGGPALVIDSFTAEGPLYPSWPPPSHEALFAGVPMKAWKDLPKGVRVPASSKNTELTPASDKPEADAKRLLARFLDCAFRRPVSDADVQPYLAIVRDRLGKTESFESALGGQPLGPSE